MLFIIEEVLYLLCYCQATRRDFFVCKFYLLFWCCFFRTCKALQESLGQTGTLIFENYLLDF